MKKTFITLIFSFLIAFSLFLPQAYAQDIPTLIPYVTDLANVIDSSYEDMINDYATQLEAATTAEIAVLTVDSTYPSSIEQYAVEVFEKNGIGQADEDNGILIVVAMQDRKWRIEVGYGLEGDINDAKAGRIGRTYITPYFQQEQYGEGLYLTVTTLGEIISGNQTLSEQFDYEGPDFGIMIFVLTIMLLLVLPAVLIPIYYHICPKCHSWMKVEQKGKKVCYVCKKCGYKKCMKKKKRRYAPFFVFVGGGRGGGSYSGGGFGGGAGGGGGASGGF